MQTKREIRNERKDVTWVSENIKEGRINTKKERKWDKIAETKRQRVRNRQT